MVSWRVQSCPLLQALLVLFKAGARRSHPMKVGCWLKMGMSETGTESCLPRTWDKQDKQKLGSS